MKRYLAHKTRMSLPLSFVPNPGAVAEESAEQVRAFAAMFARIRSAFVDLLLAVLSGQTGRTQAAVLADSVSALTAKFAGNALAFVDVDLASFTGKSRQTIAFSPLIGQSTRSSIEARCGKTFLGLRIAKQLVGSVFAILDAVADFALVQTYAARTPEVAGVALSRRGAQKTPPQLPARVGTEVVEAEFGFVPMKLAVDDAVQIDALVLSRDDDISRLITASITAIAILALIRAAIAVKFSAFPIAAAIG